MSTKQGDILSTQENADDNPKQNSPLIEREEIQGTPFTLIRQTFADGNAYYIVMGDYRMTEPIKNKEETLKKLETEKWLIITNVIITVVTKIAKFTNNVEKLEKIIEEKKSQEEQYETESL